MPDREERIAENETRFRDANETLLHRFEEMKIDPEETIFLCECGDSDCTQTIRLTLSEYESVRSDANTFALVPGHEDAATEAVTEAVIAKNERFTVVEKRAEYRDITEGSDPR